VKYKRSKKYLFHLKNVFDEAKKNNKYSNLSEKNSIIKSYAKKAKNVLDLGCGSLNHSNSLAKLNNINFIEAIDENKFSSEFINDKKKIFFFKKNLNKKFYTYKKKYDLILAMSLIHFLDNKKKFLINVKKLMKKKSIFIISFPNVFFDLFSLNERTDIFYKRYFSNKDKIFKELQKKKIGKNKFNIYKNNKSFENINLFELADEMQNLGFNILDIKFFKIHKNLPVKNKFDIFYSDKEQKKLKIWQKILCSSTIMLICNYDNKWQ